MRGERNEKESRKMILLTGVLCILSLAVCACGKTEEAPDAEEPRMFQGEPIQEDDIKDDVSTPEPSAEQLEAQTTTGTSAEWVDSTPNLEGDAKDLKDGQLTVVESVTENQITAGISWYRLAAGMILILIRLHYPRYSIIRGES